MWIEKTPEIGDVVKVEFAEFTKMRAAIGIVVGFLDGNWKIDFGDLIRFLDKQATYFVYVNNYLK